jgi:hypothetical protein
MTEYRPDRCHPSPIPRSLLNFPQSFRVSDYFDAWDCVSRAWKFMTHVREPTPHLRTSFLPCRVTPYRWITRQQHAGGKITRYV